MTITLLLYDWKLNFLIFNTVLHSSLILCVQTHTVSYRNALDRLHVCLNIIFLIVSLSFSQVVKLNEGIVLLS